MQSFFRHDLPRKFALSFTSLQAITQAVSWVLDKGGDDHMVAKLISGFPVSKKGRSIQCTE